MDTNAQQINNSRQLSTVSWHYETLPRRTKKALMFLSEEKWLKESGWYLAGGTALALSTGNRKSLDLDFFTQEKNFNEKNLITRFLENKEWQTDIEEKTPFTANFLRPK